MDCSLPGSTAHGIFQARVLEWGVIGGGRFAEFENAVTAASAVWDGLTFQLAAKDA